MGTQKECLPKTLPFLKPLNLFYILNFYTLYGFNYNSNRSLKVVLKILNDRNNYTILVFFCSPLDGKKEIFLFLNFN
jgi:hypothetical protein